MEIIPAILTSKPGEVRGWLRRVAAAGKFRRVQIDFVDGEYADNRSIKVEECGSIRNYSGIKFDAHLMVVEKNVREYAQAAKEAGFDRIIAQVESISRPEEFSGLALDLHSPVAAIEPYLERLEVVVVMAVEPGRGGQKFSEEVTEKIKRLNKLREQFKLKFKICVDGGVEKEHLSQLAAAGADEAAVGVKRVLDW
ncbi:hypothetical protein A3H89_00025 [Candidatus Amesbacteria bacterium RIFCSPLOWO2_02_FULL_48_11]|uniref:Ribulose-phosphate 3-epimerase n=4 Tax=Candidatus Amesiibacteriota TaxID=1752730 RepID=A0A1F4ZDN7_9BACT|nr:MAG: Ribulose-phosphate 3-epimerase [Candidatus Amesbacteria bacterium GW2011_GWA1_48_9]OGC89415.1 MAG: hypothetical protein A2V48_04345 [Candidatus Amesbacteria bacterium RBG_19FT_COMBO_48_16]OGC95712.1 MAG: hypothetical protein A3C34_01075 [Candidatus Amesbacteria bacterium RIFCSPHIGHO2_02_FULL_48_21]OGC99143.1 MAG: hypothetical protein A2W16_03545 [Candidatus Amesbacteria bacterium RBG_16_48_31]OGC99644.1 MAG: hypothetical protein A2702_00065 [Candidatus Amesbacteria bacterium RIFCSPHIGHO